MFLENNDLPPPADPLPLPEKKKVDNSHLHF